MKSADHYTLGCFLLKQLNEEPDNLNKQMFLFGCIEPDLNPITYLRGSFKHHFLHGHNAANVENHLYCLIKKLYLNGVSSPIQWFILGTAMHYVADSFTFPHNELFNGTMREHCEYENLLHSVFEKYLKMYDKSNQKFSVEINDMKNYHDKYLADSRSFLTDCWYIVGISLDLFRTFTQREILWNNDNGGLLC